MTYSTPFVYVSEPDNNIGAEGARALADGVKGLKGLESLSLGSECVIRCWPSPTIANNAHAHITQPRPRALCGVRVTVWCMRVNVGVC